MTILLFLSAFALSSIAAYYAIMGLMAIFSGAAMSIAVMGGALEVSKLVVASWLYRNWKETTFLLKTYFIIAILVLMTLTSMGIFGYLSKAHSDQGMVTGDVQAKIEIIDQKIAYQKEIIKDARTILDQLDQQIQKYTDLGAVSRGVKARADQRGDREAAYKSIETAQATIAKLNDEKAPLAQEARKVDAEVGPIRYVAALIYNDNTDASTLEKAVRVMILMIVGVFDPLAVLMFIAFNQSSLRSIEPIEEPIQVQREEVETEEFPIVEIKDEDKKLEDVVQSDTPAEVPVVAESSPEVKKKLTDTPSRHIIIGDQFSVRDTIKIEKF